MSKLFSEKSKRGRNLLLVILPLIVLVVVFSILAFSSLKGLVGSTTGGSSSSSFSNSIEDMDYHLRSGATDLQKSLFSDLKTECEKSEKDDKAIALLVAKNFVADFYTWTNKSGTTDVGGLYYVYSPNRVSLLYQARRYMYQHLNDYIKEYGSKNLLEVESFGEDPKVNVGTVEINGKTYPLYSFTLTWKYKNSSGGFDTSKYDTSSWFEVYKNDDGRFEIIMIGE